MGGTAAMRFNMFAHRFNVLGHMFFLGLYLSGCASTGSGSGDDTLASLGEELPITIEKDAVIHSARAKAMEGYWEFMNNAPADSLRVEALRRLADLELERSEEAYQQQLEKLVEQESRISRNEQIELKGLSYEKAIKLYEDALQASADGGIDDPQVLYQLSKAYEQVGKPEKALKALNRLLASFPDIKNRDEVHFRRGELFFKLKKFHQAELAYSQSMVVNSSSPFYEKALSQRGWSAYKQNKYQKALFSFFAIVDRKLRDIEGGGMDNSQLSRGDQEILDDTFRVILLSFNELGGASAVTEYFEQHGKKTYEPRVYKGLGDSYLEQGRIKDATDAYTAYVARNPFSVDAPRFDQFAIDANAKGGFASLALEAKIAFAQQYRINGPYWQKQSLAQQRKLIPIIANNMEELASHYHAVAQKTKNPADYQHAVAWYRQYIKAFSKTKKAAEINFLLAEALFENRQFEEAAKEYEITAYQYVKAGKNAEAGYAALVAYDEHTKTLQGKRKEIFQRVAIGSALRFGRTFPEEARASTVLMKAAEDLFALQKYDQAAVAAKSVLELIGKTTEKMRLTAWMIVAQSELENGKFSQAESAYKMAQTMAKNDPALTKTIEEGIAAAIYKRGEAMRQTGDMEGALAQFRRIAAEVPNTEANIAAQFDVAANYMASEDWEKAIVEFQRFQSNYPGHDFQAKVSENLVMAYVKTDKPLYAAEELENILQNQPNLRQRQEVMWQIAQLYEQAETHDKMIMAYEQYVREYPQPLAQATEARHKIATAYKSMGNNKMYVQWLKEVIQSDKFAGANGTDRTKFLAAKASFELAEPTLKSFREIQLTAPLQANLAKKKQRMQTAIDAYTQAANYGVEEVTTASVYLLAEIYGSFGKELLNSERPAGLSPDELEQYDILLEEQAYPFEEKAITIHETNVERVKEGTYDEWVQKSFAALQELRPVRYAKAEKSETVVNALY
jgi:tetratricopeptide (TPR) repeat protein